MLEAVKIVIEYCFNVLKLDFLVFIDNNQSKRVQENVGFNIMN